MDETEFLNEVFKLEELRGMEVGIEEFKNRLDRYEEILKTDRNKQLILRLKTNMMNLQTHITLDRSKIQETIQDGIAEYIE
jgi:plasmid replication initiation protein